MRCLTYDESAPWLAAVDVGINGNRNLLLPLRSSNVMTSMPREARTLNSLSARLTDWLRCDFGQMIWLSNWETYPPDQFILFEKIRRGCGESRSPIEAPGHLFESSTDEENAMMTGLMFFIMAFNWEGYFVAQNRKAYVYLGDEHIVFSNSDDDKMRELSQLINKYNLRVIKDIREAWQK